MKYNRILLLAATVAGLLIGASIAWADDLRITGTVSGDKTYDSPEGIVFDAAVLDNTANVAATSTFEVHLKPGTKIQKGARLVVTMRDNDGLSNRCEMKYFEDLDEFPHGDYDGDKLTNAQECLWPDYDPTIANEWSCPEGYAFENGVCKRDPVCACGDDCYDADDGICKEAIDACAAGYIPRPGDAHCYRDPNLDCPSGTTFANGRCEVPATYSCPNPAGPQNTSQSACNSTCTVEKCRRETHEVPDHVCGKYLEGHHGTPFKNQEIYDAFEELFSEMSWLCTKEEIETGTLFWVALVGPPYDQIFKEAGTFRWYGTYRDELAGYRCSIDNQIYDQASSCATNCQQPEPCTRNDCPAYAPKLSGTTCWAPLTCANGGILADGECTIERSCNSDEMDYDSAYDDGQDRYCTQANPCPYGGTLVPEDDKCHVTHGKYTVGAKISPPDGADAERRPQIDVGFEDNFYWESTKGKEALYAINGNVAAVISWYPNDNDDDQSSATISQSVTTLWPKTPQRHIAFSPPVNLKPSNTPFSQMDVLYYTQEEANKPDVKNDAFSCDAVGYSVLMFKRSASSEPLFVVVETVLWDDPRALESQAADCVIGREITPSEAHNGECGTIYLINENAPYAATTKEIEPFDGYNRAQRKGPVIPVNRDYDPAVTDTSDLVGINYQKGAGGICWPYRSTRYNPAWPSVSAADTIILAGRTGKDLSSMKAHKVYYQNSREAAGFNPNEEHAFIRDGTVYALRDDLNNLGGKPTSDPFVLVKYLNDAGDQWQFKVYAVVAEGSDENGKEHDFVYCNDADECGQTWYTAGKLLRKPWPMHQLDDSQQSLDATYGHAGPFWRDRKQRFHIRAAGDDGGTSQIVMRYFYPYEKTDHGFYIPAAYGPEPDDNAALAWLDMKITAEHQAPTQGTPMDVTYQVQWPDNAPVLQIGKSLMDAMQDHMQRSLRDVNANSDFSLEIIYQQADTAQNGNKTGVKLIDPLASRKINLNDYEDITGIPSGIKTAVDTDSGERYFPQLPPTLQLRLLYSPTDNILRFRGDHYPKISGIANDHLLLPNVMTEREKQTLLDLFRAHPQFTRPIEDLYDLCSTMIEVKPADTKWDALALSSAATDWSARDQGYVTLALYNHSDKEVVNQSYSPELAVIRVGEAFYAGHLVPIEEVGYFDERLSMRITNDFSGHADDYEFEWYYRVDDEYFDIENYSEPETDANGDIDNSNGWTRFDLANRPHPDSAADDGVGMVEITLGEKNTDPVLLTMTDSYFICRYRRVDPEAVQFPGSHDWSPWTEAKLAAGWVKRVVGNFDMYNEPSSGWIKGVEKAFLSYHDNNTTVSMIEMAGKPWAGDIVLNEGVAAESDLSYLQLYQTILNRAKRLTVDTVNYPVGGVPAVDNALMLITSRISDLYMLLGNEAFADAQDPTISFGIDPSGNEHQQRAGRLHAFGGLTSSLLEEELALLRGRDGWTGSWYNKLPPNMPEAADPTGGKVAYKLNYDIQNRNGDDVIDVLDAGKMFPQGHGDAWGHYLSAVKSYYSLLKHDRVVWKPGVESLYLGGISVSVGMLHERKFAQAAAAKARTGAQIVNLTYRDAYVEDPRAQYQGYKDDEPVRAWGLSEWASRAGQGAYFDWVVGNAMVLPRDDRNQGIRKIDRTTVAELRQIASAAYEVQKEVDNADLGLNPLGLAKNFIPFDINPSEYGTASHFEQIHARAVRLLANAVTVFNYANQSANQLRRLTDQSAEMRRLVEERQADFKNRLIEIFGYPYAEDIGGAGSYAGGYDGPDLINFDVMNTARLLGNESIDDVTEYEIELTTYDVEPFSADGSDPDNIVTGGGIKATSRTVKKYLSAKGYGHVKPATWSRRKAPGELQFALSDLVQANYRFGRTLTDYDNLMAEIEDQVGLLKAQYDLAAAEIDVLVQGREQQQRLNDLIASSRVRQLEFRSAERNASIYANALAEALPTSAGFSVDATSAIRSAIRLAGAVKAGYMARNADRESVVEMNHQAAKEMAQLSDSIELTSIRTESEITRLLLQLTQLVRQEAALRLTLYTSQETVAQLGGRYLATLQRGLRLLDDKLRFQVQTASDVTDYRYRDMAFRIFRNDALQKYRAYFDLAARYVYMSALAYDYETAFLEGDSRHPGDDFMRSIIRSRTLGEFNAEGMPLIVTDCTGSDCERGLADPLMRLNQTWEHLTDFNLTLDRDEGFSLRHGLFRIQPDQSGDKVWKETLRRHSVANIMEIPEFKTLAVIPDAYNAVEPGIVIEFPTFIRNGFNLFGKHPKLPREASYGTSYIGYKIRGAGVKFANYDDSKLLKDPNIYLIPVGTDITRANTCNDVDARRQWTILEQVLPNPYALTKEGLTNNTGWIPLHDALENSDGNIFNIRKYNAILSINSIDPSNNHFSQAEMNYDTRLAGRSVWNSRWLLVIPSRELGIDLSDPAYGVTHFVGDDPSSSHGGVSDIIINFQTRAHAKSWSPPCRSFSSISSQQTDEADIEK
jgi:hypothetical protein